MTETVASETVRPESVGISAARLRRIDEYLERMIAAERLAGAVTLISRHGQICLYRSVGVADREAGLPMRRDSIFRLASMTKPIACTAVLMLFEEGHFLLEDPVAQFIPEFADTKVFRAENGLADLASPITIRHLLTHTSGIGYSFSSVAGVRAMYDEHRIDRPDERLAEKIPRLAQIPLNHQPGEKWTYGFSHDVLARLIEVISGTTFDEFLRRRMFEPLGMVDTGYSWSGSDRDRVTAVYTPRSGGGLDRDEGQRDVAFQAAFTGGSGGLVSTASDYARYCQMMLGRGLAGDVRLLGPKTVDLMTMNHIGAIRARGADTPVDWSHDAYGFGLGVRVLTDLAWSNAGGSIGEYGWAGAASTYFWIDPLEDLYGIFLTQLVPPDFRFAREVMALTYQAVID